MLRSICLLGMVLLLSTTLSWAGEQIVVAGTGDSQDLLRGIARSYQAEFPDIKVDVPDSIGSSGGVKAVAASACDFGRVARPLKDKEKAPGIVHQVFAFSPVVFVVNTMVKGVDNLSSEQIVGIYSGTISNWKELGGPDQQIFVVGREVGDSSRSVLEKKLPGFAAIDHVVSVPYYSTPEARDALVKNPWAVGYLPLAMARNTALRVIALDHQTPESESVLSGQYPMVTPFGLVWKEPLKPEAQKFLAFLKTPAAQEIMHKFDVIPAK